MLIFKLVFTLLVRCSIGFRDTSFKYDVMVMTFKGSFTRKSDFELSLFLFSKMNYLNAKTHPEIGRVNRPKNGCIFVSLSRMIYVILIEMLVGVSILSLYMN
jgi:hypothetical protein